MTQENLWSFGQVCRLCPWCFFRSFRRCWWSWGNKQKKVDKDNKTDVEVLEVSCIEIKEEKPKVKVPEAALVVKVEIKKLDNEP